MLSPEIVKTIHTNIVNTIEKANGESWNNKVKRFQCTFETNFVKYFQNREEIINRNAWINIHLFGTSPSPKAIYGKNGMFFERNNLTFFTFFDINKP